MSNDTQNHDWINTLVKPYLSKLPPIYTALVTIALIVFGFQQPHLSTCEVKTNEPTQSQLQQYNSRADYERLQIGMSQVKVESILGRGIEIERSHSSSTLIWKNPDNSSIKAIFENAKLIRKYQEDLE